jgi:hypothetical protein
MPFCGLFFASHPKFGNPDWIIKWLGVIDRLYLHGLVFGPENNPPPFLRWPPSPRVDVMGDEYCDDCIVCLPACVGRTVKRYLRALMFELRFLKFLFSLKSNWAVSPGLNWHWFLWISAHGKRESSPLFITYKHHSSTSRYLTYLLTPEWK